MVTFYMEILTGTRRDIALFLAQIGLAKSMQHSHPIYWAAFELHGRER
jgi:CHAT domain-containing protein